jgi:hypothetical protein
MPNFPTLQKISGRVSKISWQENDLFAMICKRFIYSNIFDQKNIGFTNREIFYKVFPKNMDGRTDTWSWIIKHLSDGNGIVTPRTLIQFINCAIDLQKDKESRENEKREYIESNSLIDIEQIKLAYKKLVMKDVSILFLRRTTLMVRL